MSPPQINLGQKLTAVVSQTQLPIEKIDKTSVVYVANVERQGKGICRKFSRRCRIISCIVVITVIVGAIALGLGLKFGLSHHGDDYYYYDLYDRGNWCGTQDYYDYGNVEVISCTNWTCLYGEFRIIENVWIDDDQRIIQAEHEHGSHSEPSMHILEDYVHYMAAHKDRDENVCYISLIQEAYSQGVSRWHMYERHRFRPSTTYRYHSDIPVQPDQLKYEAGEHIHKHCLMAESYWAEKIYMAYVTENLTIVEI